MLLRLPLLLLPIGEASTACAAAASARKYKSSSVTDEDGEDKGEIKLAFAAALVAKLAKHDRRDDSR